jgi:hypothetical protein
MKRFAYVFSIVFILFVNLKGSSAYISKSNIHNASPLYFLNTSDASCIKVDEPLRPYYASFVNYIELNGIKSDYLARKIDDIVLYPLEEGLYGLYSPENRQIVINSKYLYSATILRKVMFHELGHVYGLNHSESGIMQTYQTPLDIYVSYFTGGEYDPSIWESHKAQMVSDIKESLIYIINR